MALISAVFVSIILMSAERFLFGIFVNDAGVVEIGIHMMNVIAPAYLLFAFIEVFSGALRAQGSSGSLHADHDGWHLCAPYDLVTLVAAHGTLEQVIICYPITWAAGALAMSIYYIYKQRKIFQAR